MPGAIAVKRVTVATLLAMVKGWTKYTTSSSTTYYSSDAQVLIRCTLMLSGLRIELSQCTSPAGKRIDFPREIGGVNGIRRTYSSPQQLCSTRGSGGRERRWWDRQRGRRSRESPRVLLRGDQKEPRSVCYLPSIVCLSCNC